MRIRTWCWFLPALLAGCGESLPGVAPGESDRATAVVTIQWPARSAPRMIPTLAESIQIELTTGASAGRVTDTQIVARPPNGGVSTVTFENVTPGPASVIATAFPAPAAQGVAQATGRLDFELLEGETHQATVTMASTVATWVAGPAPAPLPVGRTVDLTVQALDAGGATVLVPPATWQIATGTGLVHLTPVDGTRCTVAADAAGTATVVARCEQETGQAGSVLVSAPVTVTVVALPTVSAQVAPTRPTVTQRVDFTATAVVDPTLGQVAVWDWDLDGDGLFELTGLASPAVSTSYPTAGARTATVRVTDNFGSTATAQVVVLSLIHI